MSFFSKVADFLSGGIGEAIVDATKEYFPPNMSDLEKSTLELAIKQASRKQELLLLEFARKETIIFNDRIKQMEGTAKDLNQFGILGKLVVFLRGLQRPFWGFATFYLDSRWLFGIHEFSERQELALVLINVLVLSFLFGERAMKNIMPLIARISEARNIRSRDNGIEHEK